MAVSISKLTWVKIGVGVLFVGNLAAALPVYQKFSEDPMASLGTVVSSGPTKVDIAVDRDTEQGNIRVGIPPQSLNGWDPFKAPKIARAPGPDDVDTSSQAPVARPVVAIATDNIKILGIISLNGSYSILVKVGDEPTTEVRRGQVLAGTENIRCVEIRRDGMMLAQPGSLNTFVGLGRPEMHAQPWYQAADEHAIRGRIELRENTRRRR